jgi:tetratricopeptide (TPR) repeat protein
VTEARACLDEEIVVGFGEQTLPPDQRAAAEAHARTCPSCRRRLEDSLAAASVQASATVALEARVQVKAREQSGEPTIPDEPASLPPTPPLERGASIGRYTILSLVGRGGMGEVYAAYDPELDRKVALKLLLGRMGGDGRSQARLLREAKAIAKLSHGNVVVVHDAGAYQDRVFVAMEFVDGRTVKEWLAEAPRSRREILDVFLAAGRGLAAAHAAGLVHRDFKPHNVMVGKDGGVRVMDFGLAREIGAAPDEADADAAAGVVENVGGLTLTGEIIGTPLYMAPEQFLGTPTDARTDQFSFCVALYHALYGIHPFGGGNTMQTILARVVAGELAPLPSKHDVPTWLRRVLLRGLSVDPAARWPSMTALIEALEQDPARTRRRWGATAGVSLLVAAAVVTLVRGPGRSESLCRGGPARLAGAWEAPSAAARPRAEAVTAAFAATGLAGAADQARRVEAALDRYANEWLGMYRDACEATQVRGEQSAETLDLRMTCLDQRKTALVALTDILRVADKAVVATSVDAVNALPTLDTCADIKLLRADVEPPPAAARPRVGELRQRLAVAKALDDTGQHKRSVAEGQSLEREARALGYRPLLAEVLATTGLFQNGFGGDAAATAKRLSEAALMALAAKRDDIAAEAGASLVGVAGYYLHRHEEGQHWSRFTRAVLDRMGAGHDRVRAWLLQAEAQMKLQDGDASGALALAHEAAELKRKALAPDHPDIALSREMEAEALVKLGKPADALKISDEVLASLTRAYGPASAQVAKTLSNRGEYLLELGRAADAEPVFRESLKLWEAQSGPDEPFLAFPLAGLGRALLELRRPGDAIAPLERAARLRSSEGDPALVAETRTALARARAAAR